MDHRALLDKLSQSFSRENLTTFLRAASGGFALKQVDYSRYVDSETYVREFQKRGQIDFQDGIRLIILKGKLEKELTSHTGKWWSLI